MIVWGIWGIVISTVWAVVGIVILTQRPPGTIKEYQKFIALGPVTIVMMGLVIIGWILRPVVWAAFKFILWINWNKAAYLFIALAAMYFAGHLVAAEKLPMLVLAFTLMAGIAIYLAITEKKK